MLEQLFGSKTRVQLLKLFLNNPTQSYYLREITRLLQTQINSVRREVLNLEKIGIVSAVEVEEKDKPKEKSSAKKYYVANVNFILFPELKGLLLKSELLLESNLIKQIMKISNVQNLILTGIFTGNEEQGVDMLLVGNINKKKLAVLVKKFEKNFNHEIKYTVLSRAEYKYRRDITDKFLYSILEGRKIEVVGSL